MGSWLVRRRLSHVSSRLRTLRDELAMVDEQLAHLRDDADDMALLARAPLTVARLNRLSPAALLRTPVTIWASADQLPLRPLARLTGSDPRAA